MASKAKGNQLVISPPMTANEVAAYLQIHVHTVYRMVRADQIPHFRVGGKYRFSVEAIDRWRKAGEERLTEPME
jgi:excisionase family DNA binding protein